MHGIICMWSGVIADIPDGWALCDGTQGTPDLSNRFVRPASIDFSPHQIGGTFKHDHVNSVSIEGHTHAGSSDSRAPYLAAGDELLSDPPNGNLSSQTTGHEHVLSIEEDTHAHVVNIAQAWNLPVWYSLCFIMKL